MTPGSPFLARNLATPYFGREPKAKVATVTKSLSLFLMPSWSLNTPLYSFKMLRAREQVSSF
jgi:hypothetical protein